jgi:hypothetical protein
MVTIMLCAGCANEMAPTGGAKDTEPPKMVSSKPENESLRFKGKSIKIRFNEYIDYTINPGEIQLTPEMEKAPLFYVENKTLNIVFKEPLKPNTTYNFQFGNSIKDVTEKNTLVGFSYCISTGDSLDKGALNGEVKYASDLQIPEDCIIGLYSDSNFNKKPLYFAKNYKDGTFSFKNIKSGNYYVVAFEDVNGNRIYERFDGDVGFLSSKTMVKDSSEKIKLLLFPDIIKSLDRILFDKDKNYLAFSKPIDKIEISAAPKNEIEYSKFNETHDTLFLWYKNKTDSITYQSKYSGTTYSIKTKANNIKDSLYFLNNTFEGMSPLADIILSTNHPLKSHTKEKFTILEDSTKRVDGIKINLKSQDLCVSLSFTKKENKTYYIMIEDSALVDIFGNYNRKNIQKITTTKENDFGNLILKAVGETGNLIVELFDERNQKVEKGLFTSSTKVVRFNHLKKDKYKLLGTIDENKNGYWDSGDFKKGIQPELKILLKENIEIKGGWDVDAEIKL